MWIKAIAGVVTELDRSGPMAGFGGLVQGGVGLGDFGGVWHRYPAAADPRIHRASSTPREFCQLAVA